MSEREKFVLRALEAGANVSELCREFGISRKTGYKWIDRFEKGGVAGLADVSRRPHSSPLRASGEVVLQVLALRRQKPRWGAKKLHKVLSRTIPVAELPKVRTIARILERAGEIVKRAPSSEVHAPTSAPKVDVSAPNDLWTVDFKGHWRTRNGSRAEPLTVRDACSRFVLAARLLESNDHIEVRHVFLQLFQRHGMPAAIQVDNGTPFIAMRSPGGFTKLSAWWVSLGIRVIRGRPGHPQDNSGHERMHLDMRFDVEDVPEGDLDAQQLAIDAWMAEFNHVRPHESLDMATPAELYRKSTRRYIGPRRAWYPSDYTPRSVTSKGYVKFGGRPYYVGMAFTGQVVAVRGRDDDTVDVLFYDVPLGTFRTAA